MNRLRSATSSDFELVSRRFQLWGLPRRVYGRLLLTGSEGDDGGRNILLPQRTKPGTMVGPWNLCENCRRFRCQIHACRIIPPTQSVFLKIVSSPGLRNVVFAASILSPDSSEDVPVNLKVQSWPVPSPSGCFHPGARALTSVDGPALSRSMSIPAVVIHRGCTLSRSTVRLAGSFSLRRSGRFRGGPLSSASARYRSGAA